MVKWSVLSIQCIVYTCVLSSYLYDGHHIIGDNGSGKNVPAHLCELGVVQRHRHHLGDVCLFFAIFSLFFEDDKKPRGSGRCSCSSSRWDSAAGREAACKCQPHN